MQNSLCSDGLSYGLLRALSLLSLSAVVTISVYSGSYYVEFSINPGKSFEICFDFSSAKDDLFHEPASTLVPNGVAYILH